jgi:DNA-directed RNA polymerase subunit RPC12/RpoP
MIQLPVNVNPLYLLGCARCSYVVRFETWEAKLRFMAPCDYRILGTPHASPGWSEDGEVLCPVCQVKI